MREEAAKLRTIAGPGGQGRKTRETCNLESVGGGVRGTGGPQRCAGPAVGPTSRGVQAGVYRCLGGHSNTVCRWYRCAGIKVCMCALPSEETFTLRRGQGCPG